mmetsp:Transcript_75001/g.121117  ORF Transcript_75001/g.121117 Transcript_75001/m.121117 type:complete len:90 (-) Transcript_75001:52-321(-)
MAPTIWDLEPAMAAPGSTLAEVTPRAKSRLLRPEWVSGDSDGDRGDVKEAPRRPLLSHPQADASSNTDVRTPGLLLRSWRWPAHTIAVR